MVNFNVFMNAEKHNSLLDKVHNNSARKMTRFNRPITLSNYKHGAYTVLLVLKSGCW